MLSHGQLIFNNLRLSSLITLKPESENSQRVQSATSNFASNKLEVPLEPVVVSDEVFKRLACVKPTPSRHLFKRGFNFGAVSGMSGL